jgi:phosphoribosylformylglycinamidine (FGAM) synthase-like amidotransferase family enzyme
LQQKAVKVRYLQRFPDTDRGRPFTGRIIAQQKPQVYLPQHSHESANQNSLVTQFIDPQRALKIPLAHGEGNYFADADVLKALNDNDQVLFRYCDEAGNITDESNPNGSIENIAGVTNINRNVFGFMPHPERASESLVGNEDGLAIFESILSLARA